MFSRPIPTKWYRTLTDIYSRYIDWSNITSSVSRSHQLYVSQQLLTNVITLGSSRHYEEKDIWEHRPTTWKGLHAEATGSSYWCCRAGAPICWSRWTPISWACFVGLGERLAHICASAGLLQRWCYRTPFIESFALLIYCSRSNRNKVFVLCSGEMAEFWPFKLDIDFKFDSD